MHRRPLAIILLAAALVLALTSAVLASPPRNFTAPLSGDQEVIPVDTNARGVAHFQLSRDGTELGYHLNVANIHDVTMAHIHIDSPGGPVVAWLYPSSPPPELISDRVSGPLATGTLTDDDLIFHEEVQSLDALLAQIVAGNAYVNVHTEAHPGGEIAGAIDRPRGHVDR
jgi:hypothetical protein